MTARNARIFLRGNAVRRQRRQHARRASRLTEARCARPRRAAQGALGLIGGHLVVRGTEGLATLRSACDGLRQVPEITEIPAITSAGAAQARECSAAFLLVSYTPLAPPIAQHGSKTRLSCAVSDGAHASFCYSFHASAARALVRTPAPCSSSAAAMLARTTVIRAVSEYGKAWTTQDADRIAALFTEDAVYVERAFDRNGTFVGREQIREYWLRQICGKQTSIRFRHVERDLVIDSTRPVAVVKWLAEFDNFREKRADKAEKLVRFCQVARLEFRGDQICYLEEYGQSVSGPGARWPPCLPRGRARGAHPQALQGVRRRGDVRQVPGALRLALEALRAPAGDAVRRGPVRESNFTAPSC